MPEAFHARFPVLVQPKTKRPAADEAPRRTREKNPWYPGYMSYHAARNLEGGRGGGGLIFAILPAIHKNKFPEIKITANIFPAKIYSRVNIL